MLEMFSDNEIKVKADRLSLALSFYICALWYLTSYKLSESVAKLILILLFNENLFSKTIL